MLEIKNELSIPINLSLSPVQKHGNSLDIVIPAGGTHKTNTNTCTMRVSVSRLSTLMWKGIIPTCTSYPIIINPMGLLTHNGIPLVNTANSRNFIASYCIYILVTILVIACVWYCRRKTFK